MYTLNFLLFQYPKRGLIVHTLKFFDWRLCLLFDHHLQEMFLNGGEPLSEEVSRVEEKI